MTPIGELLPWRVTRLEIDRGREWATNPSIHFDGHTWRCSVRFADYAFRDGRQVRPAGVSHNIPVRYAHEILHLEPLTWAALERFPIREADGLPRISERGYEDMRLFMSASDGLQGIVASAQLRGCGGHEQVLVSFGNGYDIVSALPLRGRTWLPPQKNWSPFDRADEPRFLYSIDRGIVHGVAGPVGAPITPMANALAPRSVVPSGTMGRRPFNGLRGGSQLVYLGDDEWLGIGHHADLSRGMKLYWHTWFVVDSNAARIHTSRPMKLAREPIEFAAGLAVDGDRVVVSYGVDDAEAWIGESSLQAVRRLFVR